MSLPRFSVNQSLFVNLVSVLIIIAGLIVVFGMNREIFPNVDFETVSVTTAYPGATPLDIEKLITTPIEKELKEVDDIKEIKSSSTSGVSFIVVKLDPDARDKKKVVNDIQTAVDRTKDLPKDIYQDPVVNEISTRQYPIIEVSLSGNMSEKKLQHYADGLEDILEDIKGVARIKKSGYRDKEIQVHVDPAKMQEQYVSFDEIEQALASRNISVPAGEINTETTEYSIRTTGEFSTAQEIEDIIVRANDSGNWLRIKDVAEVVDSFKEEDTINKTLGTLSVNLIVMKKESGDAITIVKEIKKLSSRFLENRTDQLKISYVNDYSFFARRRLNVLKNNGWASFILVVLSVLLFLQRRVAFMTVLGIPIAFLATFMVMGAMGITINLISMFGLIIVLGMLVDDGIIVAENVYRYMEEGVKPREAAVKGSEEVMGAVTTAVLTTIAAFCPLLFMTGIIGKFIRNIPTVLIVALLASLGEALIILPSHLADFVKIKYDSMGKPVNMSKDMAWFKKLVKFYTKVVTSAIKRKYKVLAGFTIVLIACVFLAFGAIKFILFPSAGINYFFIRGEAPIGTPLERTNELILPVEEIASQLPPEEMDAFVTSVGSIQEDRHDPFAGQASHLVQVSVYLTPEQDRKRNVDEIIESLRQKTKDIKGFTELRFDKPQSGPPVGKAVEARIRGEHFETLDKIAFEYMDHLKTINGIMDVTWDHKPGKEEIRIKVDNDKATLAGLTVAQIAKTVRAVFEGSIATKIKPVKAEEETDVTVMFPQEFSKDERVFDNILVRNKYGNLIPLKNVARVEKVPGTTTIHHLDGKRVVTASANVDTDKITSLKANALLEKRFKDTPDRYIGYSVKYGGEQEETLDSLKSLLKAFFYAFLIIYLILASSFKSIVQPFIIMLAIPFGLIGVIIAFFVHGMPLSFMAILGIVGLNGIVVNDSIVLVDFINKLRQKGMPRRDSIIKACQMRLRPVILTTITTVGGLSTVAYGIGGKDPFLVPMALSICWGLAFATALTLIVIPCIYSIVDDMALKVTQKPSMIRIAKVGNNSLT
ncbi:MAG: efflux RND transporter permease subunit [Candidatus Omnitrophica bacterium]|nr:efflux RND transporter permease subunit [Candidatus Omnitrophota bacterium]MBU4589930.1 efflux RND transporter permease subunit [Candidatus Omnitrophota bacterium]